MGKPIVVAEGARSERRTHERRRRILYGLVIGGVVWGRRRGPRRASDGGSYYVDRYEPMLFGVATSIFLLSCLDALFTLLLLSMGAVEVNVLMVPLLESGPRTFVNGKLGLTATALVFLVAHSSHRVLGVLRVRHMLYAAVGSYFLVFCHQLGMLSRFPHG